MLTKRQLEDAAKCKSNEACMTCKVWKIEYDGMFDCIERLAQTAIAYRKTLERLETVLKQARAALEEIEKCCEINIDDGYHSCQRKCREAAARARFAREVIDELEESE